eukprot:CAMPEP_0116054004 /NCGR_PEP_ID=MMETSP0322-20121206/2534_1 /TAXON_ID=163516 /ORGANISM="Leptocylindrus danicus var. apora, Strain B651" /LENGTH=233 /DNA_ID=CAMNT_0003537295 /DNA_START=195 /DNA_END=896 /DNA_ORIENTATION=+
MSSSLQKNSTTADDIRSEKQKLRKEIRAKVRLLPVDELKRQSEMVWDNLVRLDEYKSAKTVGLFLSMPANEIDTRGILKKSIEEDGKVVYVPRVGLDFEHCDMEMIQLKLSEGSRVGSTDEIWNVWPKNKWGIPEPPICTSSESIVAKTNDIDLLIVPGVCFDATGARLGQGKGYYDRFIAKIRSNNDHADNTHRPTPRLVAALLEERRIPTSRHDFPMEKICSPEKVVTIEF